MTQGMRSRLSPAEKTDIWSRRWKSGQSLHEIGRVTCPSCFTANARYPSSFSSYCQASPSGNFFTARHGMGSMKCASDIVVSNFTLPCSQRQRHSNVQKIDECLARCSRSDDVSNDAILRVLTKNKILKEAQAELQRRTSLSLSRFCLTSLSPTSFLCQRDFLAGRC